MNVSRRTLLNVLAVPLALIASGCSGGDNPRIVEAPPPVAKPEEKELSKGMPTGYGQSDKYQKAMERGANR
jgi:hypothetical protein